MKKFSIFLVAQILLLGLCTQAESWIPGVPEIKIPEFDLGFWSYLIKGILIIVAAIAVYRLIKWM